MDWNRITAGAPPVVAIATFGAMAAGGLLAPTAAAGFILATVVAYLYPQPPPPPPPPAVPTGASSSAVEASRPSSPTIGPFVALGIAAAACAI